MKTITISLTDDVDAMSLLATLTSIEGVSIVRVQGTNPTAVPSPRPPINNVPAAKPKTMGEVVYAFFASRPGQEIHLDAVRKVLKSKGYATAPHDAIFHARQLHKNKIFRVEGKAGTYTFRD